MPRQKKILEELIKIVDLEELRTMPWENESGFLSKLCNDQGSLTKLTGLCHKLSKNFIDGDKVRGKFENIDQI